MGILYGRRGVVVVEPKAQQQGRDGGLGGSSLCEEDGVVTEIGGETVGGGVDGGEGGGREGELEIPFWV
jgi:hypothetical protein